MYESVSYQMPNTIQQAVRDLWLNNSVNTGCLRTTKENSERAFLIFWKHLHIFGLESFAM